MEAIYLVAQPDLATIYSRLVKTVQPTCINMISIEIYF